MKVEMIKKLIVEEIPKGISSEIKQNGNMVLINNNIHLTGEEDRRAANDELNAIIDVLKKHHYDYIVEQSPETYNAQYGIHINGKTAQFLAELVHNIEKLLGNHDWEKAKDEINKLDDVNIVDKYGRPLLIIAIYATKENDDPQDVIKLLLDKGADPNQYSHDPYDRDIIDTPLNCAWTAKVIRQLLEKGADINIGWGKYGTALTNIMDHLKIGENEIYEIIKAYIDYGADINKSCAVSKACSKGYFKIVNLLLDNGADIDTEEKNELLKSIKNGAIKDKSLKKMISKKVGHPTWFLGI